MAYDSVASTIAPYHHAAASEVAQRLDTEVLTQRYSHSCVRRPECRHPGAPEPRRAIHHSIIRPSTSSSHVMAPGSGAAAVDQCPDQYPHWLDKSGESRL